MNRWGILIGLCIVALIIGFFVGSAFGKRSYEKKLKQNAVDAVAGEAQEETDSPTD